MFSPGFCLLSFPSCHILQPSCTLTGSWLALFLYGSFQTSPLATMTMHHPTSRPATTAREVSRWVQVSPQDSRVFSQTSQEQLHQVPVDKRIHWRPPRQGNCVDQGDPVVCKQARQAPQLPSQALFKEKRGLTTTTQRGTQGNNE